MLENAWFLIITILVGIILTTDPKTSIVGAQTSQLNMLFSSASAGKKFFQTLTWILILMFYTTTLLLSYYN